MRTAVEKLREPVKELVHDVVSDSDTESYYDSEHSGDFESESGDDPNAEITEDREPTKKQMARAVVKLGREYEEVKKRLAELVAKNEQLEKKLKATKTAEKRVTIKQEIAEVKKDIAEVKKEATETTTKDE
jgi:seryl-tRNA synthetase